MNRDRSSGVATPSQQHKSRRTLCERLESRVLYSADFGGMLPPPLLGITSPTQSSLYVGSLNQQVEVATVQASGAVGPYVRIDLVTLDQLRSEAAVRRQELFQKAAERSSLLWSANDDWSDTEEWAVVRGDAGGAPSVDPAAARIAARAARVADAWNRVRASNHPFDSNASTDGDVRYNSGQVSGGTMSPHASRGDWAVPVAMPQRDSVIAVVYNNNIIALNERWDPVDNLAGHIDLFGGSEFMSASDGVVNLTFSNGFATMRAPVATTTTTTPTSDAVEMYGTPAGVETADATASATQQLTPGGHTRSGPASKGARAVVTRGEEDEDQRRNEQFLTSVGATRGSHKGESVIADNADASLIGTDGSTAGMLMSGAAHGVTVFSNVASILSNDAAVSSAVAAGKSIVVVQNGLAAVAAAADVMGTGLAARGLNNALNAPGLVTNGALFGAQGLARAGRNAVEAVENITAPFLPDGAPAGAGFGFLEPTRGMILGLAPVWNWGDTAGDRADAALRAESLGRAWRYAAAGSLVVTMAGCWYCATAAKRLSRARRRRRVSDRARFATVRRIQFSPRPV